MGSLDESGLVSHPYDKFWDEPPSRREIQRAINKLAANDSDLNGMCDTLAIINNFLCESLGVTRKQLDDYVDKKKAEVASKKAKIEAMKVAQDAAQSEVFLDA